MLPDIVLIGARIYVFDRSRSRRLLADAMDGLQQQRYVLISYRIVLVVISAKVNEVNIGGD